MILCVLSASLQRFYRAQPLTKEAWKEAHDEGGRIVDFAGILEQIRMGVRTGPSLHSNNFAPRSTLLRQAEMIHHSASHDGMEPVMMAILSFFAEGTHIYI